MTDLDTSEAAEAQAPPDWQNLTYEVFNPSYSVGVACNRSGVIVGVHLGDEVWENSDSWLATEIVRVARLAYLRSRVGRRAELLYNGGSPRSADSMGMITEAEYNFQWKTEFARDL
ncbi:hypothetical protein [Nocardia sp. NBC_01009]|uniref:hypothetical protein n=1 Tax=Nocardia sp. NBC_01009 TaxID=2975996 RepID=UPI00386C1D48|nr:hypothetical protein OHA42_04790 [Nocardia sp. NBC_01009]